MLDLNQESFPSEPHLDSPKTLQDLCVLFISLHFDEVSETNPGLVDESLLCDDSSSNDRLTISRSAIFSLYDDEEQQLEFLGHIAAASGEFCDDDELIFPIDYNAAGSAKIQSEAENEEEEIKYFLPEEVTDSLIARFCQDKNLNDRKLSLLRSGLTKVRRVRITNPGSVTLKDLTKSLNGQILTSLDLRNFKESPISDVIKFCLNRKTIDELKVLHLPNCTFHDSRRNQMVMTSLSQLKMLVSLDVSGTEINSVALNFIMEDLPHLEHLDISRTKLSEIDCLAKSRERLKSLVMHDVSLPPWDVHRGSEFQYYTDIILSLTELRLLDISENPAENIFSFSHSPVKPTVVAWKLLADPSNLPKLIHLDLSAKRKIPRLMLRRFIEGRKDFRFLGLAFCSYFDGEETYENEDEEERDFFDDDEEQKTQFKDMTVTGSMNLEQIVETLRRYVSRRRYMQKALNLLFPLTGTLTEPRPDIIELVINAAKAHETSSNIQVACTACLFNLSRGEVGQRLHPRILGLIVASDLEAMERFPRQQQLQKNVLLTICQDKILQDKVSIDNYKCARLVMDSLSYWNDTSMNRMAVTIVGILAAKISTAETSELGSKPAYMRKLLGIVDAKRAAGTVDSMFKITLSALWNLTDESPKTCSVFLEEQGLKLFLEVLETFKGQEAVETKILGLVNNIAEVPELRCKLIVKEFIPVLKYLLKSENMDVSYFAAGISAQLTSDPMADWSDVGEGSTQRGDLQKTLDDVVSNWVSPNEEMVAYRSFQPFFPLMEPQQASSVQLWAVWAVHHVLTKNPRKYCDMLKRDGGERVVRILSESGDTDEKVKKLTDGILNRLSL